MPPASIIARGRIIVTSDGDLQNDPRDIPAMVETLERGYDIVCGWRKDRKDAFLSRRLPSMVANRLISAATGVRLHDYGCSLKVFRAEVVKPLKLYGEMHRFLPAIASEQGVAIARDRRESSRAQARQVEVRHRPNDPRDARPDDREVPARAIRRGRCRSSAWSASPGAAGLGNPAWLAYVAAHRPGVDWRAALLLFGILLVFTGVQLVTLGLLAEMQARTYHESQSKPIYVIREVIESTPVEHSSVRR